jgi:tRNA U54 and U55 pseudouridine synthase Pus10
MKGFNFYSAKQFASKIDIPVRDVYLLVKYFNYGRRIADTQWMFRDTDVTRWHKMMRWYGRREKDGK